MNGICETAETVLQANYEMGVGNSRCAGTGPSTVGARASEFALTLESFHEGSFE